MSINKTKFKEYLTEKPEFSGEFADFVNQMTENLIEYAEQEHDASLDQLAHFLVSMIPGLTFGEVAQFIPDEDLTNTGKHEKEEWLKVRKSEMAENRKVISVLVEAVKLYGYDDLSVEVDDDGMIGIMVVEHRCDPQPYMSAVARYNKCNIENLRNCLDLFGVGYTL